MSFAVYAIKPAPKPVKPAIVDAAEVLSVYSGKDSKCCCGCSGKHYYAAAKVAAASKSRGYEVTPDEVNDRMIKKVVGIINKADDVDDERDAHGFVSTVIGSRLYVVYLGKE